jgi:leucyl/phenylalanyl-tRNA---protein transferase
LKFPDPERAGPGGLLALGGDLSPQTLENAYTQGIFPWPEPGQPLLWFSPNPRGVLFFDQFKVPKSTRKAIRDHHFTITFDQAFAQVIEACAQRPRPQQMGTWIIPEMVAAYQELHKMGHAHSVEAWSKGELVGGLYGVEFLGVFSGESMFFTQTEASKVCLAIMVDRLKSQGHLWMDIQMVTPLLAQMGGSELPRKEFLSMLKSRQQAYLRSQN